MSSEPGTPDPTSVDHFVQQKYRHGFVTDIESETVPPGLNEDVVRWISARKEEPEWLLEWRLEAYRRWLGMNQPDWAHLKIEPVDFQAISYFSAPKSDKDRPQSLDEVDPKLLETYDKLGVPLHERARLAGVAVDAVFDSVSMGTTFRKELKKAGVIFCSFSEAVKDYPDLVRKYLGSVVPPRDNFFAALNSAVFSDGSFVFIPKGRSLPDGTEHLFSHQRGRNRPVRAHADHCRGQAAYVSYLEGCTAPMRDENQLHAAVVELVVPSKTPRSSTRRSRTGIRGTKTALAASITSSPSAVTVAAIDPRFPGRRWKPGPPLPGNIRPAFCVVSAPWVSSTPLH